MTATSWFIVLVNKGAAQGMSASDDYLEMSFYRIAQYHYLSTL